MEIATDPPDIRWQADGVLAGPKLWPRLVRGELFRGNAASFLLENAQRYGDLVSFHAVGRPVLQFNHPELVQEMLVRDAAHRDARFFPEPLRFDPSRFTSEAKAMQPRMAYFPFGAGGRQCIGEGLAWLEGTLALAALMQGWRVRPLEGAPRTIALVPSVTLRPRGPVMLCVERRA